MNKIFIPSKRAGTIFVWTYTSIVTGAIVLLIVLPKNEYPSLHYFLGLIVYCFGLPLGIGALYHLLQLASGRQLENLEPSTRRGKRIFYGCLLLFILVASVLLALGVLWLNELKVGSDS